MATQYSISINSDRVHISMDKVPVETHLFSTYVDSDTCIDDAKQIAIGLAVVKALKINNGTVTVNELL